MAMSIKNQISAIIRCTFIDIRYMEQYTLKSPYGLVQASYNVHKTLILLYFESAYKIYKNIQNGANYK